MMASSSRRKNPIEMILMPYCSAGTVPSAVGLGSVRALMSVGMVGPYTSASMIPTRAPVLASARARLAAAGSTTNAWPAPICGVLTPGPRRQVHGRVVDDSVGAVVAAKHVHGLRRRELVLLYGRLATATSRQQGHCRHGE